MWQIPRQSRYQIHYQHTSVPCSGGHIWVKTRQSRYQLRYYTSFLCSVLSMHCTNINSTIARLCPSFWFCPCPYLPLKPVDHNIDSSFRTPLSSCSGAVHVLYSISILSLRLCPFISGSVHAPYPTSVPLFYLHPIALVPSMCKFDKVLVRLPLKPANPI